MPAPRTLSYALATFALLSTAARAAEPKWKVHAINDRSPFEAAGAFDVDKDGKLDVVSGDSWYKAPNWEKHKVRDVEKVGTYYNCFMSQPMDVNADGKMDYITCAYFGQNVGWVENPGDPDKPWTYHEIDKPGNSEAGVLVDLTGDGVPEILPNSVNVVVWYELEKAGPNPKWIKHDLGNAAAGHGVGTGDINGDGKVDILTPKGWFESPANPSTDTWTWHADWKDQGGLGIQILAKDVDGDGLADLVFGNGHNFGLFWMKQNKPEDGKRSFADRKPIDEKLSSVHTLLWADLDGDGKANELVSGKRVYAHEIEAGDVEAPVVAWYAFDRDKGEWTRHVITQGEPAKDAPKDGGKRDALKDFARGTVGTGLEMTAIDMDGDGDLDLLCPGKSGLYWVENLGSKP